MPVNLSSSSEPIAATHLRRDEICTTFEPGSDSESLGFVSIVPVYLHLQVGVLCNAGPLRTHLAQLRENFMRRGRSAAPRHMPVRWSLGLRAS